MRPSPPGAMAMSRAGAMGGVAPVHLLDVQTSAGNLYHWSDRPLSGIAPAISAADVQPVSWTVELTTWSESTQSVGITFSSPPPFLDGSHVVMSNYGSDLAFLNQVAGTVRFLQEDGRLLAITPDVAVSHADADAPNEGTLTTAPLVIAVEYVPWILGVGEFSFFRSTQTSTGSLTVQNLGGDVLQSDFERIVRRNTLEGALAVYRYYSVDLQWAWIEQHGTLSVTGQPRSSAKLSLTQMRKGQDDTPEQQVSETCQLYWGEKRCGATGTTECLYSYQSCQVPEHFVGIQTSFEINNPAAPAELPQQTINRARPW